jgi:ERCC4-related helicase
MAADSEDVAGLLGLAGDREFQREIAALRAKATFKELLGAAPDFRWPFTAERAVRNATALHLLLRRLTPDVESLHDVAVAARVTAQAWEGLATLEDHTSRAGALINAAVAYEIAGFQANAACLARLVTDARAWSAEPTFEGLAAAYIQRLLLRVLTGSKELVRAPGDIASIDDDEFGRRMAEAIGVRGLASASRFLLGGDRQYLEQAAELLSIARQGFDALGDVRRTNLTANLLAMLPVVEARSIWATAAELVPGNLRWKRYLRVLARGLGAQVLDSRSISELWPSQIAALAGGLLDSTTSKIVKMPTSAGKTRVAEMAIVHALVTRPGARCLYVAPYRALVTEVEVSFATLFADVGFQSSAVSGSYENDMLGWLAVSEDRVLVLTPEKLDLVLRLEPETLDEVALVVLDEGHIVGDSSRGARYELLVTRLRRRLPEARFLFLSAVVPHQTLVEFATWIKATAGDVVESDWRPSIQRLARLEWSPTRGVGVLRYDVSSSDDVLAQYLPNLIRENKFEYVNPRTQRVRREVFPEAGNKGHIAAALAWELAAQGPVLIFCGQTDWAQSVGNALARRLELAELTDEAIPSTFRPTSPPRSYFVALEWLGADDPTTRSFASGVGVHHGRQPEAVRLAIEEDFRQRRLAVLTATTTLAQGVNLPVRTVIIHSVWRYDEETNSRVRLPARDYWNIAGRAGRAGEETEGTIIHIVKNAMDRDDYDYYRRARESVEPVVSALYQLLIDLVESRISPESVASKLDAELLALLVEEGAAELDEAALTAIINDSLAAVQAQRDGRQTRPIIQSLAVGAARIAELVPDATLRRVFSSTGLKSDSCVAIAQHVEGNRVEVKQLISEAGYGEINDLLRLILDGLSGVEEMQPRSAYGGNVHDLLVRWLEGRPVADELAAMGEGEDVSRFIEEYFTYLLPWGTTAYLRIAAYLLDVGAIASVVAGLASLVKYGVPTLESAWAMSAGVPDRQTAILLAGLYSAEGGESSVAKFRRWLGDLDPEELAEERGVSEAALPNLRRAIFRTTHSQALARLDEGRPLLPLIVSVRVSRRAMVDIGALKPDLILDVARDYDSAYRNATRVQSDGRIIGYLRLSDALVVGPELDAGTDVEARVLAVRADGGRALLDLELTVRLESHAEASARGRG